MRKTTAKNTKLHPIQWVADQLGISVRQVHRLAKSGDLVKVKLGPRMSRITDESFQAYVARGKEAAGVI